MGHTRCCKSERATLAGLARGLNLFVTLQYYVGGRVGRFIQLRVKLGVRVCSVSPG